MKAFSIAEVMGRNSAASEFRVSCRAQTSVRVAASFSLADITIVGASADAIPREADIYNQEM